MKVKLSSLLTILTVFMASTVHGANYRLELCDKEGAISGFGEIDKVLDGETIIVKVSSPDIYGQFREAADTKEKELHVNDDFQAVRMRLGFIDPSASEQMTPLPNRRDDQDPRSFLKQTAEGEQTLFICWTHNELGMPVCGATVGSRDIGLIMLANRMGRYETSKGTHPCLNPAYRQIDENYNQESSSQLNFR